MDNRTKRQKLEAMANQSVSPEEAEIAKRKLQELPPDPVPQTPPGAFMFINGMPVGRVFTWEVSLNMNGGQFFWDSNGNGHFRPSGE